MSDKLFSIGKAISEVVVRRDLTGVERTTHFELEREAESSLNDFRWMRGSNKRDIGLNVPVELFTRQLVAGSSPLVGVQTFGISNLLTWSACLRAGATILTGLRGNTTLWSIGQLPVPQWLPEIGMATSSDPVFAGYSVSPKRISGMLTVSRQLLVQQTGPELDRILISDLSRQLASYLDQCALYGTGSPQPLGLTGIAGVNQAFPINVSDLHGSFCDLESTIEAANVSMDSYGILVSPGVRKILRTTPSFMGGSLTTWSEIRGGQSSPEITDGRCFAGCWNNMTFCLWGRGIELLIDAVTMALTGQVKIYANLLCDVGVRYPAAFAVTTPVTAY
jgi:Phage capsid family